MWRVNVPKKMAPNGATEWKTGRDRGFHAAFLSDRINLYDTRQPLLQKSRWESTRERVIYVLEILNEQFLGAVFSPPWNGLFPILEIICHRKTKICHFRARWENTGWWLHPQIAPRPPRSATGTGLTRRGSLTRMMGQIELGGRMWSFRGPQSHSGFTWEAHLLWSWRRRRRRRRRRWQSLSTATFVYRKQMHVAGEHFICITCVVGFTLY